MKISVLLTAVILSFSIKTIAQRTPKPYGPLPTQRQLQWQETEVYSIIHLSMATFSDKEWGYGNDPLTSFNPKQFNAEKIIAAAKAAGIKGIVVVAKHHDGFCLWPTKTTSYNISNAPYKNGKGDVLKQYQAACQKAGLKMGIYCSPWDRNSSLYGSDRYVKEIYREQLRELYHNYGDLFISWHDGANGGDGYYGGANEQRKIDKTHYYGWDSTFSITRELQPGAVIFGDAGPDVRWVGNEEGVAGEPCWATFTPHAVEGDIPANGNVKYWESVNGTRDGKYWIPAECDVPLRSGWFYHHSEDGQSKTPYQLVKLYYESVGKGACLDLGLSPDKSGLLTIEDTEKLKAFGTIIRSTFAVNLARQAKFNPSNIRGNGNRIFGTANLTDNNRYTYWATDDNVHDPSLLVTLTKPQIFNVIRLRENIKLGQRIDSVKIEALNKNHWQIIATVSSIGANRLIRLKTNVHSNKLRLKIYSPVCIALSDFGLFREPDHLSSPVISKNKAGKIEIVTEAPVRDLQYTIDGNTPNTLSKHYVAPFDLSNGGTIKAVSRGTGGEKSLVTSKTFDVDKGDWKIFSNPPNGSTGIQNAIDDNEKTFWFDSQQDQPAAKEIDVDMGKPRLIKAFTYLPRQDKNSNGIVIGYSFSTSDDGVNWIKVGEGEFANIISNPIKQIVPLVKPVTARYFKFNVITTVHNSNPAIAELGIR